MSCYSTDWITPVMLGGLIIGCFFLWRRSERALAALEKSANGG